MRIYSGHDAEFELYIDEGDHYNYENGAFATVRIAWKDALQRLTLEERIGTYPGMKTAMSFKVTFFSKDGSCEDSRILHYEGQAISLNIG